LAESVGTPLFVDFATLHTGGINTSSPSPALSGVEYHYGVEAAAATMVEVECRMSGALAPAIFDL
jgi:hypothetical protein